MLSDQLRREFGAWDIRWYYTVFARGGLVLFPPRTLVINIGFDGSGTHDRLALPARQAPLDTDTSFGLPAAISETSNKVHVFDAIGSFRHSSAPRRLIALLGVGLRRRGSR